MTNSYTSYRCTTFQGYTRRGVTDRKKRGESPHLASYMSAPYAYISFLVFFWFSVGCYLFAFIGVFSGYLRFQNIAGYIRNHIQFSSYI